MTCPLPLLSDKSDVLINLCRFLQRFWPAVWERRVWCWCSCRCAHWQVSRSTRLRSFSGAMRRTWLSSFCVSLTAWVQPPSCPCILQFWPIGRRRSSVREWWALLSPAGIWVRRWTRMTCPQEQCPYLIVRRTQTFIKFCKITAPNSREI